MAYAYRRHSTTIELDAGQTATYRLPPMTPGMIIIDAKNVHTAGGSPQGPGGSGTGMPGRGHPNCARTWVTSVHMDRDR